MKNFSLKALGAFIFAAGLVVAGVAAPAAAAAALSISATQFDVNTATASGLSAEITGATFATDLDTIVVGPSSGWTNVGTCPLFANAQVGNLADCGISALTFGGVSATMGDWKAYRPSGSVSTIRLNNPNGAASFTTGQAIKVTFSAGAWTTPNAATVTDFVMQTYSNGGSTVDSLSSNLTVGTPQFTVTFNGNSATSGTMNPQTAGSSTALTTNTFARTGYTFAGWNTQLGGSGTAYANGASYPFTSSTTLYAQWTANANCSIGTGNYFYLTRGNGGTTNNGLTSCGYLNQTTAGTLPARNYTRSGYTFTGWNTAADGSGTAFPAGTTFTITRNISAGTGTQQTYYAQWATGSGSSASANMTIDAATGQLVAGSNVSVVASGLQTTAPYTVVVQSTPQTLGSGNAIAGAVNTIVTLPAGLEEGWHTLTFTSTGSDGSAVTSVSYFKVSASGTLLATSSTLPTELANTGINNTAGISLLAGGLSLALVGAEMFMIARRRRSN